MQILWGAVRAVSVEMIGVLAVLWMLQGATGVMIDLPWPTAKSQVAASEPRDPSDTMVARAVPAATTARVESVQDEPRRATARQWFNTIFPASDDKTSVPPEVEQRAEYAREQLDHFSRLYGIASRD